MNKLILNPNIKKLIGIYLLPSINLIKKNKSYCIMFLLNCTFHIKYSLDNNVIFNKYELLCKDFTNKKYERMNVMGIYYWIIR